MVLMNEGILDLIVKALGKDFAIEFLKSQMKKAGVSLTDKPAMKAWIRSRPDSNPTDAQIDALIKMITTNKKQESIEDDGMYLDNVYDDILDKLDHGQNYPEDKKQMLVSIAAIIKNFFGDDFPDFRRRR